MLSTLFKSTIFKEVCGIKKVLGTYVCMWVCVWGRGREYNRQMKMERWTVCLRGWSWRNDIVFSVSFIVEDAISFIRTTVFGELIIFFLPPVNVTEMKIVAVRLTGDDNSSQKWPLHIWFMTSQQGFVIINGNVFRHIL